MVESGGPGWLDKTLPPKHTHPSVVDKRQRFRMRNASIAS
jgi:hypothetical protein